MPLNVAVQMDPIERINIRGDSTFALMLEAKARGHKLSYYTTDKLAQLGDRVFATVQPLDVRDELGNHFTLGEARRTELTDFDVILLRQDPPFDMAYITTTHMLERVHPKTLVVNDPAHVRNAPEKIFVMEFADLMPPTLISRDKDEINAFRAEHGDALAQLRPVRGKTRTVKGKAITEIDHSSIPAFARKQVRDLKTGEQRDERDLGAMISLLTAAVQQLDARLDALEGRGNGNR